MTKPVALASDWALGRSRPLPSIRPQRNQSPSISRLHPGVADWHLMAFDAFNTTLI
jgi:hypothetical protein